MIAIRPLRRRRVTLGHMKRASVRELHLETSRILDRVAKGEVFLIEKRGTPVAELRPVQELPRCTPFPADLEAKLARFPKVKTDSGRFLEEDR